MDRLCCVRGDDHDLHAKSGRPSIPPERLLRALLLQIFYSVRSERLLMEQLSCNLLFRWFVGMEMDEPVWNHAVFSKNRERLLNQEVARAFFVRVLARAKPHLSDEHFSVDGTLIEAWASQKGFQKKEDGDGDGSQFRGEKRDRMCAMIYHRGLALALFVKRRRRSFEANGNPVKGVLVAPG